MEFKGAFQQCFLATLHLGSKWPYLGGVRQVSKAEERVFVLERIQESASRLNVYNAQLTSWDS